MTSVQDNNGGFYDALLSILKIIESTAFGFSEVLMFRLLGLV